MTPVEVEELPKDNPDLLKPLDAAKRLNLSRATVFKLLRSGELPAIRFGRAVRITPADLDRVTAERRSLGTDASKRA